MLEVDPHEVEAPREQLRVRGSGQREHRADQPLAREHPRPELSASGPAPFAARSDSPGLPARGPRGRRRRRGRPLSHLGDRRCSPRRCAGSGRRSAARAAASRGRLVGEHVERRGAQAPVRERVDERRLVDEPAARGVDEHGVAPHERRSRRRPIRPRVASVQRRVQRDDVARPRQQLVEPDGLDAGVAIGAGSVARTRTSNPLRRRATAARSPVADEPDVAPVSSHGVAAVPARPLARPHGARRARACAAARPASARRRGRRSSPRSPRAWCRPRRRAASLPRRRSSPCRRPTRAITRRPRRALEHRASNGSVETIAAATSASSCASSAGDRRAALGCEPQRSPAACSRAPVLRPSTS